MSYRTGERQTGHECWRVMLRILLTSAIWPGSTRRNDSKPGFFYAHQWHLVHHLVGRQIIPPRKSALKSLGHLQTHPHDWETLYPSYCVPFVHTRGGSHLFGMAWSSCRLHAS